MKNTLTQCLMGLKYDERHNMRISMKNFWMSLAGLIAILASTWALATITIPIHLTDVNGVGEEIGIVKADDTIYGLLLTPKLIHLPAGVHGFHVHEMPACTHDGMAAGGHWDPVKTDQHRGPYSNGHFGDLPVLIVDADGRARLPVLAPRLKLTDLEGRALMIHAGGDNYADSPAKLGGGGARIACGVIANHLD